jgi:hypothetical protein
MLRTLSTFVAAVILATSSIASAATNTPVLYPRDNSWRYAYGYSGIDWPVVYVQRGHVCNIMLEPGEMLSATDANDVLLDDRVRWVSVVSRSGGQRLSNGKTVPITWTVAVEPSSDADDAWLTIHTDLGRHYMVHLIPVARNDSKGEQIVAFYYWHEQAHRRFYARRQAVAKKSARSVQAASNGVGRH